MKKRILSFVIILVMTLGFLPTISFADTATSGTTGDCTWSLDGTILTISGDGEMGETEDWGTDITEIIIKNGVTSISEFAFEGCKSLTSITIPKSVKNIEWYAFDNCGELNAVHIESIEAWCNIDFGGDYSNPLMYANNLYLNGEKVTEIEIPEGTTSIGASAFYGCTDLVSVTIPDSVTSIGAYAFASTGITSIVIPDNVTRIDFRAFYSCFELEDIAIGKSVTEIGDGSFGFCQSLKNIIIPNSVISIESGAFDHCTSLESIIIPDSVTSIGGSAFNYCTSLNALTIGNSVTSIGGYAFYGCEKLADVKIPDSVVNIGECAFENTAFYYDSNNWENGDLYIGKHLISVNSENIVNGSYTIKEGTLTIGGSAFYGFPNLTDITIPDSVVGIGEYAFFYCEKLVDITIPNSVVGIGDSAFSYCIGLKTVTIGDSVTSIGDYAFYYCSSLTSIIIPNSVTTIGGYAFDLCTSLKSVTMGNSIMSIGFRAFDNCNSLESVNISDLSAWLKIDYYDYTSTLLNYAEKLYLNGELVTELVIPDGVTTIGTWAFYNYNILTSVTIPDSVTVIYYAAFAGCSSITTVNYSGSEADRKNIGIGENNNPLLNATWVYNYGSTPTPDPDTPATSGICGDNLTWSFDEDTGTLTIDGTGDMYGYDSIYGTYAPWYSIRDNITDVIIKEGVTSIGKEAFGFCRNLTNTTIPDSVVSIAESTFYGCTNLASVIIGNGVTYIGSGAFYGCENLVNVSLPENIKTINGYTFYNCKKLTSIIIPEKVTAIGNYAFADCINLASINVPNSVVTIGDYSFSGCESLKEINLPNSVTSIGTAAFSNCKSFKSITIPQNITSINKHTFSGCTNLNIVNIPESVETIDECAFEDCESLKDSNGFVTVKNILFDYYGSEENVIIPKGIKHISWRAFSNNSTITSITIPKSVTSIGAFSFVGCSNLSTVNYCGSETDRANVTIEEMGNNLLLDATWVYNYGSIPEPTPTPHTHSYDNACDTTCDCGYVRETTHSFGEYVYNNDANEKADGTKTRTCSVCGHKETVTAVGTKWQSSFTDIKTKDFYYKPTLWAVANNITTGTSKTTFSPNDACTRGQIVTFLWRAAGCPEPTTTTMPFTDVGNKAFYRKAVLWAVENGITSGTSKTTFSPNDPCTRGQIATFLWRAKGKPTPTSTNMPFNDVAKNGFYYKAVLWAVENGITSGTSKTTFEPSEPCTRGQIVTFLYRAYN